MIARTLTVMLVFTCGSAMAQGPQAWLDVDGERHNIPVTEASDGKTWGIGNYNPETQEYEWSMETDEFMVMLSGGMDPDPSIAYGIAVTDFGAPSSFGFVFSTPIVPTGTPNVVTASVVGGLTDVTGNGVSMTPTGALLQVAEVLAPATSMGVDVGPAFSSGPASPGSFYGYGPFAAGPIAGPGPGPWTTLRTTTSFMMSGGGDIFAVTGFASINQIPEPSSIALAMLAGLGLFGLFRRRR